MSLPTNFFIGRGLAKKQNFIWAMIKNTGTDARLYELDPDTLAVINKTDINTLYGFSFNSTNALNNLSCDDEGNLYAVVGKSSISAGTYAVVSFAPGGALRWINYLNRPADTQWNSSYGTTRYNATDNSVYVCVHTGTGNSLYWRLPTDGSSYTNLYTNNPSYDFADTNDPRIFEIAEEYNQILVGGANTSASSNLYGLRYSGNTLTTSGAISHISGTLGGSYSPKLGRFVYSKQYNTDDVRYIRSTASGNIISTYVLASPGTYMYGGSVMADAHPVVSSTGGGMFFSYYNNNPSYVISNSANAVYLNTISGVTNGTTGCCYNPFNRRFYIAANVTTGYGLAGADVVSFELTGTKTSATLSNVVKTASNWQTNSFSGRTVVLTHSSSIKTQRTT